VLTLREALQLAEPLRKGKVLAGHKGLDRVVQAVNVMEVPDILEWVRPGELLVTTLYPLRDNPQAQRNLIPSLAQKGLVGIAITPESYIDKIPEEMIQAADALDFPLVELPPKVSFIDIIQPLTSRILNIQANELRQSEALLREFLALVLRGGGFSDIARLIAQTLGHPVTLVDRFRRILGESPAQATPRFLVERDPSGDAFLGAAFQPQMVEHLPWGQAQVLRVGSGKKGITFVAHPIQASSMELGKILVWGTLPAPLPSAQMVALEHGATVAALKWMEGRALSQVAQHFQNEVLENLLSDQPGALDRAQKLASQLGMSLETPFWVIVASPDAWSRESSIPTEGASQSHMETSLHLARRYIRILSPRAVSWRQGTRLVTLFPSRGRSASTPDLVQALQDIARRVAQENAPYTVSMGLSNLAPTLEEFRRAYRGAMQSLELGRVLHKGSASTVTALADLGLLRLLSPGDSRDELEKFCEETLGAVVRRDKRGALLPTLQAYLESGCNLRQTAAALGVHYNTVRYRVHRLHKLLGPVLRDPRGRLNLEVALQLLPLVRGAGTLA